MSYDYKLVDEITTECDWDLYEQSYRVRCPKGATKALVDPNSKSDAGYPEGMHLAHLCDDHAEQVLLSFNKENKMPGQYQMKAGFDDTSGLGCIVNAIIAIVCIIILAALSGYPR